MFSHFAAGGTCLWKSSSDGSLAFTDASWSLILSSKLWLMESLMSLVGVVVRAHSHGIVRVVELFLSCRFMLGLMHRLSWVVTHLALLLVPRELIWVDHGQHLGETLSNTGDSLRWVSEWQLVPWHEFDLSSVHVDQALFTRSA